VANNSIPNRTKRKEKTQSKNKFLYSINITIEEKDEA
jgi:hypothetical protein